MKLWNNEIYITIICYTYHRCRPTPSFPAAAVGPSFTVLPCRRRCRPVLHSPSLSPPLSARPTQSFPVAVAVGPSYIVLPCRRRCRPALHSPSLSPPLSARPTQSFLVAVAVGPSYIVLPCRRRCRPVLHSPSLSPSLSARPTQSFPAAAVVGPSYIVLPCRRRGRPVLHSPSLSPSLSARPTQSFPAAAVVGPSYTVLPCRRRGRPVLHSPSLHPPLSARPTQSLAACVSVPRPERSRHSVQSARRVQQLHVLRASLSRLGASALLLQRPTQHAWVTVACRGLLSLTATTMERRSLRVVMVTSSVRDEGDDVRSFRTSMLFIRIIVQ